MRFDARTIWLDSVDSTNTEAMRRAAAGERGPLWVAAREQTAGRGRRGRVWRSAQSDLTASLLLEPRAWRAQTTPYETATLSYAAALAVSDMVADLGVAAPAGLKWPNDVLLGGAKLAGVLLESRDPMLAIGVGVNLRASTATLSVGEDQPPPLPRVDLSAFVADPEALRPERVMTLLAYRFAERFEAWRAGGFAALRAPWLDRAERLRGQITARLPNETIEGRFADLDPDGALVLETAQGVRRIHAADIYWPFSS